MLFDRRRILFTAGAVLIPATRTQGKMAKLKMDAGVVRQRFETANLATIPVELAGDWGEMVPASVLAVLEKMRTS